ncbi:MAG: hypothetical protein IPL23_08165 [Saprospiraceae bacterium]|nr:hypothetical protein [Saprospiraceae bacterium]
MDGVIAQGANAIQPDILKPLLPNSHTSYVDIVILSVFCSKDDHKETILKMGKEYFHSLWTRL